MATPKVLFIMADYGHDPTETAVPFSAFQEAGFEIEFATENGKSPVCDNKMLEGVTQKLLGADRSTCEAYKKMRSHPSIQSPLSWSSPSFSVEHYNLLFFPGGHEKGVRQVIDSAAVHKHLASYFPQTLRSSITSTTKAVAAVCHGVMVLSQASHANGEDAGKSVLHDATTTALPAAFERAAFWGTRVFLGDYYKTYGAGSDNVQTAVTKRLKAPEQFRNSTGFAPFVVEDPKYRYVSARWPGDAQMLAARAVEMVKGV